MKDIFDISKIESLIQSQKLETVLVMDSAILLDEPATQPMADQLGESAVRYALHSGFGVGTLQEST